MKRICAISIAFVICHHCVAQKDFEGQFVYRTNVVSKNDDISNATWKKILLLSDNITVLIKKGNYKQMSEMANVYFIHEQEKVFFRIKGYDTLYYLGYGEDTSTVLAVTKNTEKRKVAGYDCNSITIQTGSGTSRYLYSPSLYQNPEYNKNNTIGRQDVFARETSSLMLNVEEEHDMYRFTQNCVQVQPQTVDDKVFELPNLPQQKFSMKSFLKLPEFKGEKDWPGFLQKNLDGAIAARYLKPTKKEPLITQIVEVGFTVNERGQVTNPEVLNKKEVHSKLAEEAVRVVALSHWKPASIFGQPIPYKLKQPITFQVTLEN